MVPEKGGGGGRRVGLGRWAAPAVDLDWGGERVRGGNWRELAERRGAEPGREYL